MYRGARTYNGPPDSAKQCKSLPKFKEMLRTVILLFCCLVHFFKNLSLHNIGYIGGY